MFGGCSLTKFWLLVIWFRRGKSSISTCCPLCNVRVEEVDHVFFECSFSREIWEWFCSWNGLLSVTPSSRLNLLALIEATRLDKKKYKLDGPCFMLFLEYLEGKKLGGVQEFKVFCNESGE